LEVDYDYDYGGGHCLKTWVAVVGMGGERWDLDQHQLDLLMTVVPVDIKKYVEPLLNDENNIDPGR
jgi:hypothetical protein